MPSADFWIDANESHTVIVDYSGVNSPNLSRIPVLVGGNIANTNFLYLYNIDLENLPSDATLQTGTAIIPLNSVFNVSANKDNGDKYKLRLKIDLTTASGAHIFTTVYSRGGIVTFG